MMYFYLIYILLLFYANFIISLNNGGTLNKWARIGEGIRGWGNGGRRSGCWVQKFNIF